jgi:hypothetical protein
MKRQALTCVLPLVLAACASPRPTAVPGPLQPGANEVLAMTVSAQGAQTYECRQGNGETARPEWVFVAPEAELFDAHGRPIGRHGGGPHWQAHDGSRIEGKVKARVEAPEPGAIPWLLLSTATTGTPGAFSGVTSIQRINTVGGAPPAGGCSQQARGATARVPYAADYRFFSGR